MRIAQLRERLRRQEQQNRELAQQQRAIVAAGGARLTSLETGLAAIGINTGRIDALEARVDALEGHAADDARHTGRP